MTVKERWIGIRSPRGSNQEQHRWHDKIPATMSPHSCSPWFKFVAHGKVAAGSWQVAVNCDIIGDMPRNGQAACNKKWRLLPPHHHRSRLPAPRKVLLVQWLVAASLTVGLWVVVGVCVLSPSGPIIRCLVALFAGSVHFTCACTQLVPAPTTAPPPTDVMTAPTAPPWRRAEATQDNNTHFPLPHSHFVYCVCQLSTIFEGDLICPSSFAILFLAFGQATGKVNNNWASIITSTTPQLKFCTLFIFPRRLVVALR